MFSLWRLCVPPTDIQVPPDLIVNLCFYVRRVMNSGYPVSDPVSAGIGVSPPMQRSTRNEYVVV